MKSAAHDTALYLGTNGIGTVGGTAAWSIRVDEEPEAPDEVITLYDTGGQGRDTDELDIERPTIQVRVRGKDYEAAAAKQAAIRNLLTETFPIVMDTSDVAGVVDTSDILSLGQDDQKRHILVVNYRLIRTEKE